MYDLKSFEKLSVEANQSNLYNHFDPFRCQQCNHSCPNFCYNQSNTQRIEEITTNLLVKGYQTADQLDFLLKNEHPNRRKSLDIYDTFSRTSRFENPVYFLDNHNFVQCHLHNTLSSSHSNLNSEQNESFNDNLAPTLPKPDPYSLSDEDERNRGHRFLYSGPMFRMWAIPNLQQLSFSQLQPSTQQENRIISTSTDTKELNFKDQVNDSNEMNKRLSSPVSNEQLFSKLPSSLEPYFTSTCCNELCCDNGCENSSLPNRNIAMSYSWNIVGNHCNNSLGSIQPSSQPSIPLYCLEDQVVC
jgi:hypothetical protein